MGCDILFPKLGFSMNEGTLVEWLVPDGAEIKEGAPLYVLESDKSTVEIEAPATGRLRTIAQPGQVCQVGAVLGHIV